MQRDLNNEVVVAVAIVGVLAFALIFGVILSLSSAPSAMTGTLEGTATVTAAPTDTPLDMALEIAEISTQVAVALTSTDAAQIPPTVITFVLGATATLTPEPTLTPTRTLTPRSTRTATHTVTRQATRTRTHTATSTHTAQPSATLTTTHTATRAATLTYTSTATSSPSRTATATFTTTHTPSYTATSTKTHTPTATHTATVTLTPTSTATPTPLIMPTLQTDGTATLIPVTQVANACRPPANWFVYIVEGDETLYALAQHVGSTVGELRAVNCLSDSQNIVRGNVLYVPRRPELPLRMPNSIIPPEDTVYSAEGCVQGAQITNITAGERLNGVVRLFGDANLAGISAYRIEVRPAFSTEWDFYLRHFDARRNAELGILNTDLYEDGLHLIRLVVVTNGVDYQTCVIPVIFR